MVLLGHSYVMHQSWDVAFMHYLRAVHARPSDPHLNLFVGVAKLQYAMKRTAAYRHHDIVSAFAFLFQYYNLSDGDSEAAYNLGRSFHSLGVVHLARHFYEKCLAK